MAEDHFGNHNLLILFHFDRDAIAVVLHGDHSVTIASLDTHVNVFDGGHPRGGHGAHKLIACIHNDLVEDLVEARIEVEFAPDHLVRGGIIDPTRLLVGLGAADVGVREFQDVLVMRVLLILSSGHEYGVLGFSLCPRGINFYARNKVGKE